MSISELRPPVNGRANYGSPKGFAQLAGGDVNGVNVHPSAGCGHVFVMPSEKADTVNQHPYGATTTGYFVREQRFFRARFRGMLHFVQHGTTILSC